MPQRKHPDKSNEDRIETAEKDEKALQDESRSEARTVLSVNSEDPTGTEAPPEQDDVESPLPTEQDMNAMHLESELRNFTGTEQYHPSSFGRVVLTDGAHHLRETAGCYWLMDVIESYQPQLRGEEFQLWTLAVNADHSAVVTCRSDTGCPPLIEQQIEYTDFPLNHYELYCVHGVIMLKSEY